jgi:hypothetical protein
MEKLHKLVTLTLLFTIVTTSIQAQDADDQSDENYSSAYVQSSHAAHWSVYIPIAILVVAAVYLGLADEKHSNDSSSSDSQDGLGSIDSSKRHSSSSSGSSSRHYSTRNANPHHGGHGHH